MCCGGNGDSTDHAGDQVMQDASIQVDRGQRPGAEQDSRLDWWRDAKFGLFIHWGLYAIPAGVWKDEHVPGIGEWIMLRARIPVAEYSPLAERFNPVAFDAKAWVALAKAAGQKYIVITSKHHDGFCLFDSAETDYCITKGTPFGRDVIRELADECRRQDMRLGFYYSQTQDWYQPDGDGNDWDYDEARKDFAAYIDNYVKPQVRELLTKYGDVALIWFDTPKGITERQSRELLELCNELQPDCLGLRPPGQHLGRLCDHQRQHHPRRGCSGRLGSAGDHERHLGLQDPRPQLEECRGPDSKARGHRQQGWGVPAQRGAHRTGRDPAGEHRAAGGDGRVAGTVRGVALRYPGRSGAGCGRRAHHAQGRGCLPPCVRLARGRNPLPAGPGRGHGRGAGRRVGHRGRGRPDGLRLSNLGSAPDPHCSVIRLGRSA